MPTFLGKSFNTYFKNILAINQSTNTGVDTVARTIQDGAGNNTSTAISDDLFFVIPQVDNGTSTFQVSNQGGSGILAVDTTNSKVLVGASQVASTTQYAHFGVHYSNNASLAANKHYTMPFIGGGTSTSNDVDFGTGTDPDDSFTTADTDTQYASQIVPMIWRLPDNITISSITHIEGASNATGDTTRMHLKSFDFTSGSTSCLTNGTLLAHNSDITNAGNEQAYLSTWTVDSADINADKAILCFFRSDSANSDFSLNVTIKYFIR